MLTYERRLRGGITLATWRGTLHEQRVSVRVEGTYERWRWSYAIDGPGIASGAGIETNESDAIRVAFAGLRKNRHAIDR